ncbi:hypothetical protein CLV85_0244 [Salinibacterium amurskyense]|uniref:Uncharacterized protein n=1 Tax=Salinibacterium amurskyense TaxID=205941 RepID=A0A2M9D5S7_9MICO|nr:DUF6049 family protein [Salinibacterium amurskyense]PJJ81074.1 hypothetical protein CLV85_0244 [Salinibacterium amurskyense]RLQ83103.1 hypothetical protein D9C83_01215 [Salinibacterium amurskyense]GHD81666.1 hypothetical protein GCM10007394_15640 [Salinibacterium amurskyense]
MPIRVFSAAIALGLGLTLAASGASAAPAVSDVAAVTTASAETNVAVMAPMTVPAGNGGILDAETLAEYTEPLGLLTRQLDAVAGKPVAIAIDPMILASIRVLGTSAPESARSWLERLSLISNDVVPLPYAHADVTLATQSGLESTPDPISFDFALDEANFAEAEADAAVTTITGYPTTEQLLDWDYAIDGFLRPRTDTVIASDLTAFTESGFSTIVLSSTNVSRKTGAGAVTTIDGVTALISDATASAAMDNALGSTLDRDVTAADTALSEAVLDAGAAQTAGTASVLIAIDHSLEVSSARLDAALATLTASPSITMISLTELASGTPTAATIADMPQSESRIGDVTRLFNAARAERSFFSVAEDPDSLAAERRLALLDVLGTMPTEDPSDWLTQVNRFLVDSRDLRNAVTVVEASNFLLVADNGYLPVSVSNDLNQAVTVYITVDPRTGLLAVGDELVELRIEANSQAKGEIPVQSLSNGVVDVEISLTSSNGTTIGSTTVSEINVQAGWETPIVLSFAAIVVVIFAVGLVRSIVRRRKPEDD